jgi:multisubunit Na+/H+ antiporter MnhE subunit
LTDRDLPGPYRLVSPSDQGVDARVVASRGRWRLLVGMVRDNRPWRLLFGLRGAIVAAFAFSAFWMINPSVWQLSAAHGPLRLALISTGTVGAMVAWLILYHRLWESVDREDAEGREQALLFNASTVLTLSIGVTIAYVGLLVVNFAAANIVIAPSVLAETIQRSPGIADLAMLTWLATSGASMAGALGTGFESEQSVRQAAYSRREQERRSQLHEEDDRSEDEPDGDAHEETS